MKQRGAAARFPWITLGLAALLIAAGLAPEDFAGALELRRDAVAGFEWWRFLTCHLVHYGRFHALKDAVVLLPVAAYLERKDRRSLVGTLAASAIAIPSLVLLLEPGIAVYRGASGLASAVVALLAGTLALDRDRSMPVRAVAWTVLAGLTAKILYEATAGRAISAGGAVIEVAYAAHLAGAITGGPFAWLAHRKLNDRP